MVVVFVVGAVLVAVVVGIAETKVVVIVARVRQRTLEY